MLIQRDTSEKLTKKQLAIRLGISRSSLYYRHKRMRLDEEVKQQIEVVQTDNPRYGHKRIAIALKLNKKRILRVMKKFGLKPYWQRPKKPRKKGDEGKEPTKYQSLIKNLCPIRPNVVWVTDFTYIKYKGKFYYLATIIDLFMREIIGWNIGRYHNKELVLGALLDAIEKRGGIVPVYLHSDQGSEYDADAYTGYAENRGIQISMSKKAAPWENGFQESFYSEFKIDLGEVDRFETVGELIKAIHQTIYYYNNKRIHTSLKMSSVEFRILYQKKVSDIVSKEMGT